MAKARRQRAATPADWQADALQHLQKFQAQHLQALCSLPDLYALVTAKHLVTIGQYHDGIRELVHSGRIRLHPFSGPRSALEREEYALVMYKDIMYYAESV